MKRALTVGFALSAALATATACAGPKASTGGADAAPAKAAASDAASDGVTLGAVLPLTGSSATIGEDQRRGIDLAVADINSRGGVLGKPLNVVVEDSTGQANAALDAVKKLVTVNEASAVIGEYSSGITVPIAQQLQRSNVVHLNVGSSSPDMAKIGSMSFSVIGLDTLASKFTAKELINRGFKRAAFLGPNNSYGSGLQTAFKEAYAKEGGTVTADVLYTEGQQSYRAELDRLNQSNPDVFVYTAYGADATVINKEAYQSGLNKKNWFGIYLTMCTSDSPKETVEGQMGMDVNYIGPDGAAYEKAYKNKYGEDFRSTFNGYTYDAVEMLAKAIEKAGSADPAKIAEAMPAVGSDYKGVTGDIAFDADRQRVAQPYLVLKMQGGKIVTAG